jgi:expansin
VPSIYASNSGQVTYYGGNLRGGMCSFSTYNPPGNVYLTAISDANWNGSSACGVCVRVAGPAPAHTQITAMVVDQCPGCGTNHLDLFPDAFARLANPSAGIIPVTWDVVPCGISSPIAVRSKEGASRWWFSMQVLNSNVAVKQLDVSTDGGRTWQGTNRKPYNFFEKSGGGGFGTETVVIRLKAYSEESLLVYNVGVNAGQQTTAGGNFKG